MFNLFGFGKKKIVSEKKDIIIKTSADNFSDKQILNTSYNMMSEVINETNPLSNNAPFLNWDRTIKLLQEDNGEALIKLDDGTGYALIFEKEKIVFIVKEILGYPIFTNKQFYEINYNEIYKNSDDYLPSIEELEMQLEPYKYDDAEFDEGQLSIAIQRSISSNNWVFLHTNLAGTAQWLKKDNWNYYDDGIYIYPKPLDDKKYKKIQIDFDDNNFPILKASLITSLEEYTLYEN